MCSYIVEKAKLLGSAKGPNGWMRIDTANVYYDHPFHMRRSIMPSASISSTRPKAVASVLRWS